MSKHKFSDEDFAEAVKTSFSVRGTLKKLGVAPHGGSYKSFEIRVKSLGLSTAHFTGQGHLKGKKTGRPPKIELEEYLVADSNRNLTTRIKQRIIKAGIIKDACDKCGLSGLWQGEPIVLHLDHINGDHFDHRIENLRLLCPNCHSQTPTYCARNVKHRVPKVRESVFKPRARKTHTCATCGEPLKHWDAKNCKPCYDLHRTELNPYRTPFKIEWPPVDKLLDMLKDMSYLQLSKSLGVSDNAIRKHIKRHSVPSRGTNEIQETHRP